MRNTEVVSNWTPNVFYVERRLNDARLASDKVGLGDRCSVAETGQHVKTAPLVSHHTLHALEAVHKHVAGHIEAVFRREHGGALLDALVKRRRVG